MLGGRTCTLGGMYDRVIVALSILLGACGGGTSSDTADASRGDQDGSAVDARRDVPAGQQRALRFYGSGGLRGDRVRIRIDDPETTAPGPRLDIGGTDFTVEFWIRPTPGGNENPAIECGPNNDWVTSNIIIDRDRHSQPFSYGIGIAGGVIVYAITGEFASYSSCGVTDVTDGAWHHVAAQRRRSDGQMTLHIDGDLETTVMGPPGDVSYPDDGVPMDVCPDGVCDYSDPFLVFGAEKHGYGAISYNGILDEVRISDVLRYTVPFTVPDAPLSPDPNTVGLFHLDSGEGNTALDSASVADGPNHGEIVLGGDPQGPEWVTETPF